MTTQLHPITPDLRKGKALNLLLAEPARKGSSPSRRSLVVEKAIELITLKLQEDEDNQQPRA